MDVPGLQQVGPVDACYMQAHALNKLASGRQTLRDLDQAEICYMRAEALAEQSRAQDRNELLKVIYNNQVCACAYVRAYHSGASAWDKAGKTNLGSFFFALPNAYRHTRLLHQSSRARSYTHMQTYAHSSTTTPPGFAARSYCDPKPGQVLESAPQRQAGREIQKP